MRTYEYRLYPNREQRRRLDACLYDSRHIYNQMLQREKQHYARPFWRLHSCRAYR